ncbi:unnamed protein product, partial [Porites lobata]
RHEENVNQYNQATVFVSENRTSDITQSDGIEARLRKKLFGSGYDPELRPVMNQSDKVTVTLGVSLHQIIEVNEKNQFITVSLWVRQIWFDPFLTWNESEYAGIKQINIDAKSAWIPDIYLYNNADAQNDGALDRFKTKIVLSSNGRNMWLGPVLLTFSCKINVNFFPFDEQLCSMKFGSWTYDGYRVDVQMENDEGDIKKFISNGEWDLITMKVQRNEFIYVCCPEPYPDVTYTVQIRRRTMYYFMNLIIPCALITSLTLLSFFLPPDSGERITLVITNLLAMTVFMLIVAEIMPATSEVVPLISIYYTGIMFEVALSLIATCMVLKCYYNNPAVTEMPKWIRVIVLNWLAKIVRVKVPAGLINAMEKHVQEQEEVREEIDFERRNSIISQPITRQRCFSSPGDFQSKPCTTSSPYCVRSRSRTVSSEPRESGFEREALSTTGLPKLFHKFESSLQSIDEEETNSWAPALSAPSNAAHSMEVITKEALLKQDILLNNVRRLVNVTRKKEKNDIKREEWKIVASIVDACFFWLFMGALLISTLVIFLQAPSY